MDSRWLGVAIAVSASALFAVGASLQAIEARTTSRREAFRLSLLWRLLSRPRWVVGTTIAAFGWPLQILALTLAPLALVQSVDAVGLLLLLVIGSRALGESVGWREYLAVGGIIVGSAA